MSESKSEATTQELTQADHINALRRTQNVHQKDIETLTKACYMLHKRLAVVENALANVLTQHGKG